MCPSRGCFFRNRVYRRGLTPVGKEHESNSGRYDYRRGDWKKNSGVIRFNFMCPQTRNLPTSRCDIGGYLVVSYESFLPIQGDSRFVTLRTGEANVKEHF